MTLDSKGGGALLPIYYSKKSATAPTERTLKKPEYLIARSQLTERGPLGFGPIQFLMELWWIMCFMIWVFPKIGVFQKMDGL